MDQNGLPERTWHGRRKNGLIDCCRERPRHIIHRHFLKSKDPSLCIQDLTGLGQAMTKGRSWGSDRFSQARSDNPADSKLGPFEPRPESLALASFFSLWTAGPGLAPCATPPSIPAGPFLSDRTTHERKNSKKAKSSFCNKQE